MDNKDNDPKPKKEITNHDDSNQATTSSETRNPLSGDKVVNKAETNNQDASNQPMSNVETTNREVLNEASANYENTNQSNRYQNATDQPANIAGTTNRDAPNQATAESNITNQDMFNEMLAYEDETDHEARREHLSKIRKAARFEMGAPKLSITEDFRRKSWRRPESLPRLMSERELDADMFEAVLFHVGEFGRYQKLLLVAIIPFAVYFSWVYFAPMFLLLTPKPYWCKVPELSSLSKETRRDLSAPGVAEDKWDSCKVYKADWNEVLKSKQPPPPDTPLEACKNGWEHEYKEIPYDTVVSERGWVCNRAKYSLTSQSAFFAGSIAGGLTFGWMADFYGRVPALIGVNLLGGIAGMVTILTVGAWDFIACRFFYGMAYDNCFMIAYILVLEYVGPKYRTLVATLPIVLYDGTSALLLPWIAYFIANWRWFSFVTSLTMFVGCFAPWLLPESARWLLTRGRVNDAVKVMKRFEKINRTHIPENVLKKFIATSIAADKRPKDSFRTVFKSELLRQTLIFMAVTYCLLAVVYDALVRLSESFGLNFFITFTINAAFEIPSVIMVGLLLDRLGRRNLTFGPSVIATIFIVIAMFVPKGIPRVSCAVVARFLINLAFTVTVQWVAEILPTPFRATGSAALHMSGFASSLMSPLIVYSERYWSSLPLTILAVLVAIAAAFSLLVPETKGEEMPQTVADAEDIIEENSLYGHGSRESRSITHALSTVRSSTFMEPVYRRPEGRVNLRLSRLNLNQSK